MAKSPSFADQPDRVEAIAAQTAIDKINYLDSGLSEVECHNCGTCVLVRKNSFRQTSVQWQSDPNVTCPPVFRDTDRANAPREAAQTCGPASSRRCSTVRSTSPDSLRPTVMGTFGRSDRPKVPITHLWNVYRVARSTRFTVPSRQFHRKGWTRQNQFYNVFYMSMQEYDIVVVAAVPAE